MRCPVCDRRLPRGQPCPRDGARAPEPGPPLDATAPEIDGLEGLRFVGAGGFASVFVGCDRQGRQAAVKLAHQADDPRFEREAEALRRIGPPAVPELRATGVTADGRVYLVEEWLRGETVGEWLAARPGDGSAPVAEVAALALGACAALGHVHAAGIVHRDLKPENVFLRAKQPPAWDVALIDFGLARPGGTAATDAAPLALTRTGQVLGSHHYVAPEQLADARRVDERADLYSLGAILYEALTGRPPFVGDVGQIRSGHISRRPAAPSQRVPAAAALDEVVLRCLAKDPERRFASAAALAEAIALALAAAPAKAQPPAPASRPAGSSSRTAGLVGVRSALAATDITVAAEAEGGHLARTRDDGYLLLFPHLSAEEAVRAALRAANALRPLVDPADLLMVHAAEVRLRESARGVQGMGPALDEPGDWWREEETASGVVISPAAAALLDGRSAAPVTPATAVTAGLAVSLPPPLGPPPVVGREPVVEELRASAEQAVRDRAPTLATLVGEVGHGKSRILEAVAERLPERTRILRVRFQSPDAAEVESGAAVLCRALGLPVPEGPRHEVAKQIAAALRPPPLQPTAVIVDDAQWADPCALDALELATLEPGAPLWLLAATGPELLERRPLWGDRSVRQLVHRLAPLDAEAELALLRHLFLPIEFIPADVLQSVRAMAHGVPLFLVEIVDALRAGGAFRRSPSGAGWYLAGDELLRVSATPLGNRLGARQLARVPPALRGFAELCAVLGDGFSREDAVNAERAVSWDDAGAGEALDPEVGLDRLRRLGVLHQGGDGRYLFRHPLLREAIEDSIAPARRRHLHRLVLEELSARPGRPAPRAVIARHAARCGDHEQAFANHFALAEEARAGHHDTTADEHYTAALTHLGDEDPRRGAVLAGRGKVRCRGQRFADAIEDLHVSRPHFQAAGDRRACADLLLEEAKIEDWRERWTESAALVAEAGPLVEALREPALEARWSMAHGRTHFRAGRLNEALEHLDRGRRRAGEIGDHETWAIASMLHAGALVSAGRLDEAETRFAAIIDSCERAHDTLHLCSAYNNRIFVWLKRELLERAIADQRRATALARELAHVLLERASTGNLAELLFWRGDLAEAHGLAVRARDLQARFLGDTPVDALLVARISAALGDLAAAERELAWISEHCPSEKQSPLERTMVRLVQLLVARTRADAAGWPALIEEARQTAVLYELQEVIQFALEAALRDGLPDLGRRYADEGARAAGQAPLWRERFAALAARVDAVSRGDAVSRS